MPKTNPARRRELTDAAIDLLAASGVHGLTHRAVEQAAAVPPGTASNYFRTREALLVATAERILDLHLADMDEAAKTPARPPATKADRETGKEDGSAGEIADRLAEALAASLLQAATTFRSRYRAIFELQLEAARRPALAAALNRLQEVSIGHTAAHHAETGLAIPTEAIPTLITLYGGALFTLVTMPTVDATHIHQTAHAIAHGALCGPSA